MICLNSSEECGDVSGVEVETGVVSAALCCIELSAWGAGGCDCRWRSEGGVRKVSVCAYRAFREGVSSDVWAAIL